MTQGLARSKVLRRTHSIGLGHVSQNDDHGWEFYLATSLLVLRDKAVRSSWVRLDQKCKNYAIQVIELSERHSIRKRTFISYSSQYSTEAWLAGIPVAS